MTPNNLEVLIHYHVSSEPHPRSNAPAVAEAINKFLREGIFEAKPNGTGGIQLTEKGKAWLKVLLNTPYPTIRWVDQNGVEIE